jgi:mono/diheme cytochrome c family protein
MAMIALPFRSGLAACLLALLTGACGDRPTRASEPTAPEPSGGPADATEQVGGSLYRTHCAVCHGEQGDGNGIVKLDRPARSFRQGAFSFGNTPAALARTVKSGIGGTPMPGFGKLLSEEEVAAVVRVVLAFGPEQPSASAESAEMRVGDRPLVVRGGLPPIAEGLPVMPRGLLLGAVDGLSFQYDIERLRLLGVRQGAFVVRKDWENRGGDPLQPLGKLIHLVDGGDPQSMWQLASLLGGSMDVDLALRATEVSDGRAWLEYALLDGNGKEFMRIRESGSAVSLGGWSGFRRTFKSSGRPPGLMLTLREPRLPGRTVELGDDGRRARVFQQEDGTALVLLSSMDIVVDGEANAVQTVDYLFGRPDTPETLAELAEALR